MLRAYQQSAHDAAIEFVRQRVDPCVIEAPTGAGKSHIIAAIAHTLHNISGGKHVLCLAPSSELVQQNRAKYLATGNPASMYSASAGSKCLRHEVVFATPGTFKKVAHRLGHKFAAVVVDEAHGITATVKMIIEHMREGNPNLRVLGLSATPYRMGSGYIYQRDETGKAHGPEHARDPYFAERVYTISAHYLIEQGYLTPPVIGEIGGDHYETLDMQPNRRGKFDARDVDRAFVGHGRKTAAIIADVVARSRDRNGVMIFAATIEHAEECMASLPPSISAIVTGKTSKGDRNKALADFKAGRIKYLVNVAVLTTGFDAPNADVIAILRATESVGLLQQIIGRGLRINPGKRDCLVLDYAENLERHCPDGDVFSPQIKARFVSDESHEIEAECPMCGTANEFAARHNPDGFEVDRAGYFVDAAGDRIPSEHGDMPAHHGRRCLGVSHIENGQAVRCDYRWSHKVCEGCGEDNDIAARKCSSCGGELVDPNEKLRIQFKALKRDPTNRQTDKVISWAVVPSMSRAGNEVLRVEYTTEYRSFAVWYQKHPKSEPALRERDAFLKATDGGDTMPYSVTYQKSRESGFYRVHAYNQPVDEAPDQ